MKKSRASSNEWRESWRFEVKDRFRIMAYERAAVSIRDLEEDLASITKTGKA